MPSDRRSMLAPTLRSAVSRLSVVLTAVAFVIASGACGRSSPSEPEAPPEGALFRVVALNETFHILLQDSDRVAEAEELIEQGGQTLVYGRVRRGHGGFNRPWSWHLAPETVSFPETCLVFIMSRPSAVQANVDLWIETREYFCPLGQIVERVQ